MKRRNINSRLRLFGAALTMSSSFLIADISGTVFKDLPMSGTTLNTYGSKDSNEPGISGVSVKGVDASGATAQATTAADGTYTLTGLTGAVRVEFSVPSGLKESFSGSANNSAVRFVNDGDTVDFALHDPLDFSSTANPKVVTANNFAGTRASNPDENVGLYVYNWDNSTTPSSAAKFSELGSVWGVAYDRKKKRVFVAARLQRQSELGPLGIGGIYVFNASSGTPVSSGNFDLQGVSGIDFGSVDRSGGDNDINEATQPSHDLDAFDKVGKIGMGDIEIGPDGKTLWIVNLNERALIQVDVSGANLPGSVTQTKLDSISGLPSCGSDVFRPWALGFNEGRGYLGGVCSAENSKDKSKLKAYVVSFDPNNLSSGFSQELSFNLDYPREDVGGGGGNRLGAWNPWAKNWNELEAFKTPSGVSSWSHYSAPQPILSDITFSSNGDMIIGMQDRFGAQLGIYNYPAISGNESFISANAAGDILKACKIGEAYSIEGSPGCPTNDPGTGAATSRTDDGPSKNGEFFWADETSSEHNEAT